MPSLPCVKYGHVQERIKSLENSTVRYVSTGKIQVKTCRVEVSIIKLLKLLVQVSVLEIGSSET